MLILSYADGLGINFYKLRQGILQTPRHGGGASFSHIKIRKFFRGQLAGRIYGGSRFVDNHIFYRALLLLQIVGNHLFRFSGSGSISQSNNIHMVLLNQLVDFRHRLLHLIFRGSGVNDGGIQYLSGGIHHGDFTTGTKARIPAQHNLSGNGRLHQKLL